MKSHFYSTLFWACSLMIMIGMVGCDDEDPILLTASGISITIDENPTSGQVLGSVIGTTNRGNIVFSLSNQSPTGAMAIDASSGQLTVADVDAFDFESNATVTATGNVTVDGVTESAIITISLNDVDLIKNQLTTSKTSYESASDGDWIEITATEYGNLAANVSAIAKSGMTDNEYNDDITINRSGTSNWSIANVTSTATIPTDSYVFAFKYRIGLVNNGGAMLGFQVKRSTKSATEGYVDMGGALPSHTGQNENKYFVLKGYDGTKTTSEGHLGLHKPGAASIGYMRPTGGQYYFKSGELTEDFPSNSKYNALFMYQGLSTTEVQW